MLTLNARHGRRAGWWNYRDALDRQEAFRTHGALRGGPAHGAAGTGRLPESWDETYRRDCPDYIVFSYATPIAWYSTTRRMWVLPDVRYSVTTTNHQNIIRVACGGFYSDSPVEWPYDDVPPCERDW